MIILSGATVVTMDPEKRILADSAIAIQGERIVWVGQKDQIPDKFDNFQVVRLERKVIFPGFVNLHTHAALSILRGVGDDTGIAPAYSPNVPQGVFLSPQDVYIFSMLGGLEALRFGTTCIVDNYIYEHQAVSAFNELGMRAVVSERLHDADLFNVPLGIYEFDPQIGEQQLERSYDLVQHWHGKFNGRIRCRLGPHAPDTCSTTYLKNIRDAAQELDLGLVIHLAQSRREVKEIQQRSGKTVTQYLADLGMLGPQMIAGHCIFVDEDEMDLLARTGTHVSHQSGSNSRGGMMAPIKALVERGVNLGLGTDNMSGDMIEVMRLALCVARMQTGDNLALSAYDVLEMATLGGARALGMEHEIGSIEVGKKADLVVVDYQKPHLVPMKDPIANLVHNGQGSDIDMVMVDGYIVIKDGHAITIDEDALLREAQRASDALWRKMAGNSSY